MDESIPPGHWLTVAEAHALVPDVSRRRIQALATGVGDKPARVKSCKVLGRLLIDRAALLAWAKTPRHGGRPKAPPPAPKPRKGNR